MEINTYTELSELLTVYLTKKKLRKTEERYTIFKHICAFPGHFDINMLNDVLDKDNFHVSKATLYNTLEMLINAGLVVRHQANTMPVEYELKALADTHLHLICTRCGAIRELRDHPLRTEVDRLKIPRFTPEFYCLYIYGLCSKCKYRSQQRLLK